MTQKQPQPTPETLLATIAKNVLGIETLETRNSDSLDFHEVSVWSALRLAYEAGRGFGK